MTADLAERLRNEAAVWERMDPIYGTTAGLEALLREAVDAIDSLTSERDASEHNRLRDQRVLSDRLAAAERIVEAATAMWEAYDDWYPVSDGSVAAKLRDELARYEKAYSSEQSIKEKPSSSLVLGPENLNDGGVAQMTERHADVNGDQSVGSRHGPADLNSMANTSAEKSVSGKSTGHADLNSAKGDE